MTCAERWGLLLGLVIASCGGAPRAATPDPAESDSTTAETETEEPHVPPADANAFMPRFAVRFPEGPHRSHGVEVEIPGEGEKITVSLANEGESIDSIARGVAGTMAAIVQGEAPLEVVEVGGHPARMVTVLGEERGEPLFSGFTVVDIDGWVLRLSYTVAGSESPREVFREVMGSFSHEHPGRAAEGFVVIGVPGVFLQVPQRLTRGYLRQRFEDAGGLDVWVRPAPTGDEWDIREQFTQSEPDDPQPVSDLTVRERTVAGLPGTITDMRVARTHETIDDHLAAADLDDDWVLWIRGHDLPDGVDFEAFVDSVSALP